MAALHCCLAHVVRSCIEANVFVHQLDQLELQLSKFHRSHGAYADVADRCAMIMHDLNAYFHNYFLPIVSNGLKHLARASFTLDESVDVRDAFEEELHHLEYFLRHRRTSHRPGHEQLHRLNILCTLAVQYYRGCAKAELARRFTHLRMDLWMQLRRLTEALEYRLTEINRKFHGRSQVRIRNLSRTVCMWLLLAVAIGCYLLHPAEEVKPKAKSSWSRWW